jgi:hypothetical protein
MKMGWEVNYGETNTITRDATSDGPFRDNEVLQLMWGTWFYF